MAPALVPALLAGVVHDHPDGSNRRAMTEPRQRLSHDGHEFFYRIVDGATAGYSPVLILGGAFQSMDSWDRATAVLSRYTGVILVDLPGTGASPYVSEQMGWDFYADAIRRLLDHLGVSQASVLSASYGGVIGYRFAQRYPEHIDRFVMSGIMRKFPDEMLCTSDDHLWLAEHGPRNEFAAAVMKVLLCREQAARIPRSSVIGRMIQSQLLQLSADGMRKYLANTLRLLRHPLVSLQPAPTTPVLVFTGEFDHFTRPEFGREIAAACPDALFTTIRNADHLCYLEQFEATMELLCRFLFDGDVTYSAGCGPIECFSESRRRVASV